MIYLVVSENGLGKRTDITEYRSQIRAGKGIKTYNNSEKTGKIVGARNGKWRWRNYDNKLWWSILLD